MAQEASVAPKERVNIVYRPAVGDAKEDVELPLKLMVMGDFTGRPDDRPMENREPINIDKDNFNEVLKGQEISLDFNVADKLSGNADAKMAVKLKIESIHDLGPDRIVEQVPQLKQLLALRESLSALKGPMSNFPDFRKKLQNLVKDEAARKAILKELGIRDEGGV